MESTLDLEEAVNFAIKRGATSAACYSRWASSSMDDSTSRLFNDLYRHESAQQMRLLEAQRIINLRSKGLTIRTGRLREYLVDAKPAHELTNLQALFWASVRAETSKQLYNHIGKYLNEHELRNIFHAMAHEEDKQKRKIDLAYDDLLINGMQTV
jgi:rubrerythrin